MRWSRLFADLEGRLDAERAAETAAEVAERTRIEVGRTRLTDRLRAAVGKRVVITTVAGTPYHAQLDAVGPDWVVVIDDRQDERLIASASIAAIGQLPMAIAAPYDEAAGRVAQRLDLRHALRGIARDRAPVRVVTTAAVVLSGTVDRVGADFIDIAEHHVDQARRRPDVRAVQTVPIRSFVEAVRLR